MVHPARGSMASCLVVLASLAAAPAVSAAGPNPCSALTKAEIAKVSGLDVGEGTAGPTTRGTLGKCTWTTPGHTRVILVLGDARHMQLTVEAAKESGGDEISGLGTSAVGMEGPAFTGGGYIVNVLDAKGGFGLSVLGKEGSRDRVVALAKIVEGRR